MGFLSNSSFDRRNVLSFFFAPYMHNASLPLKGFFSSVPPPSSPDLCQIQISFTLPPYLPAEITFSSLFPPFPLFPRLQCMCTRQEFTPVPGHTIAHIDVFH